MSKIFISAKRRIANALLENKDSFIGIESIAESGWGEAYMRDTKKGLEEKVKRNIGHAIELLAQSDMIVIIKKKKTDFDENKFHKVLGYKIAGPEDGSWIKRALDSKEQKADDFIESYNLFSSRLVEHSLIESDNFKKLEN